MLKKYRPFLFVLILMSLLLGAGAGHVLTGRAQSETDWTQPVNLSSSGIASNPVAVVDFRGTIHVLWVDEIDGYKYSQSQDAGSTWSSPLTVKYPFDPKDSPPLFLADANGSIHVFWINSFSEFLYAQATSESLSNPTDWIVKRLSRSISNFDVRADASGMLHLAYIENASDERGLAGVYYRQSIIGGGFWSEAVGIYQSEYFRATTSLTTYIRLAISEQSSGNAVFISWDNRPLKRVFLASSADSGQTWSDVRQFKGPEDTGGYDAPFNASVWAGGQNVLMMWQVGQPGASKCSIFSQWSEDAGKTWSGIVTLFGGPTACPIGIKFASSKAADEVAALLLNSSGDPTLIAWKAGQWSEPQSQIRLPVLSNPATYDPILFGCRQDVIVQEKLLVFGCDEARGGDVWFLSRTLVPVADWFSPSTLWSEPLILENNGQDITDIYTAADTKGNIHAIWVEVPDTQTGSKPFMQYARWSEDGWSNPETIIRNLDGVPRYLNMYLDSQDRLMLMWLDSGKGDLLYSWANLDQAGLSSGWVESVVLPTPSVLSRSPDIVVDSTGRIIVAYAVPLNEGRGIYTVQSVDNGVTWSPYVQAFDAALAKWDMVDTPEITISGDGALHLLVSRQSGLAGQPVGLYYLRSLDGGMTWSEPQIVSEGEISWSDIVAYGESMVHRLWQEKDELVVANISQESRDGGLTWGKLQDVTSVGETTSPVALASNGAGQLYFVQLLPRQLTGIVNQEKLVLKSWKWDGSVWNSDATRELAIKGNGFRYGVAAGLASNRYLGLLVSAGYSDQSGATNNQVITFGRFIEHLDVAAGPVSAVVPTPFFAPNALQSQSLPSPVPTAVVDSSVLYDSNDPSESLTRNLVGVTLIVLVVVVVFVLLLIRRPKKHLPHDLDE